MCPWFKPKQEDPNAKKWKWDEAFKNLQFLVSRYNPEKAGAPDPTNIFEQQAHNLALEAPKLALEAYGPDHPNAAASYYLSGAFFAQRGDPGQAEKAFIQAIDVFERTGDPTGKELPIYYNALGRLHFDQGKFDLAETAFQRAVTKYRLAQPEDPIAAEYMFNLAFSQAKAGEFEQAFTTLESAYNLVRTHTGEEDSFAQQIHSQMRLIQLQKRVIVEPDDPVTLEEWREFAQRVCRYLGDSATQTIICRRPGMFLKGEKAMYFVMPVENGLRVYTVDGTAPNLGTIAQITGQEHIGKFIREISGIPYPSMHKTHTIAFLSFG